jgi:hypothetical protein
VDFVHHYEKWWQHDEESPLTLVYMNNHWQEQAVGTARQLRTLMEGAGQNPS